MRRILREKISWECWESNLGPLGAKREWYPLCHAVPPNIRKIVSHQSETFNSDWCLRTNTVFDAGSEKRPELWFRLNRFTSIFFLSWEMKSVMKSLATSSITRCKNYWKQALWTAWLLDRQDRISGKVPLLKNLQVINIVCSLSTWVEAISHTKIILYQGIEYSLV